MSKIPQNVNHKPWISDLIHSRHSANNKPKTKIIFVPRPKKDSIENHNNNHERTKLKIELIQRNDLVNNSVTNCLNELTQTDLNLVNNSLVNSSTSTQTLIPGYMIKTPVSKNNKNLLGFRK